jgi:hypothetical protein
MAPRGGLRAERGIGGGCRRDCHDLGHGISTVGRMADPISREFRCGEL